MNPWDRWVSYTQMQADLTETTRRLGECEMELAVLKYERDAATDAALKWEMRCQELFPEGAEARVTFYRDLYQRWRTEAELLRGRLAEATGEPDDGVR